MCLTYVIVMYFEIIEINQKIVGVVFINQLRLIQDETYCHSRKLIFYYAYEVKQNKIKYLNISLFFPKILLMNILYISN